jgi:hypothetical protein
MPARAQFGGDTTGELEPAEQIVILLLSAFFQDYINLPTVLQNLQKYYSKT